MVGIDDAIIGILKSKSPSSVALSSIFSELKVSDRPQRQGRGKACRARHVLLEARGRISSTGLICYLCPLQKQRIIGKRNTKKTTNQALNRLIGIKAIRRDDSSGGHPEFRLNTKDERTSWDEINDLCKKYQGSAVEKYQTSVVPLRHGDRYVCDITSTWPARDSGQPVTVTGDNRPTRRSDDARVHAAHKVLLRIHQTARIKKELRREAGQLYTLALDRGTQYVINNEYPFQETTFREFKGAKNVPAVWKVQAASKAAIDNANFFVYAVNSYIKNIAEEGHEAAALAFERIELVLGIKDGSCIMHGIAQTRFDMDKQQELIRKFEDDLCLAVAEHLSKRTKPVRSPHCCPLRLGSVPILCDPRHSCSLPKALSHQRRLWHGVTISRLRTSASASTTKDDCGS